EEIVVQTTARRRKKNAGKGAESDKEEEEIEKDQGSPQLSFSDSVDMDQEENAHLSKIKIYSPPRLIISISHLSMPEFFISSLKKNAGKGAESDKEEEEIEKDQGSPQLSFSDSVDMDQEENAHLSKIKIYSPPRLIISISHLSMPEFFISSLVEFAEKHPHLVQNRRIPLLLKISLIEKVEEEDDDCSRHSHRSKLFSRRKDRRGKSLSPGCDRCSNHCNSNPIFSVYDNDDMGIGSFLYDRYQTRIGGEIGKEYAGKEYAGKEYAGKEYIAPILEEDDHESSSSSSSSIGQIDQRMCLLLSDEEDSFEKSLCKQTDTCRNAIEIATTMCGILLPERSPPDELQNVSTKIIVNLERDMEYNFQDSYLDILFLVPSDENVERMDEESIDLDSGKIDEEEEVQISASSTFLCFHIPLLLMHFTGMFNGWVRGAEGQGVVKVKAHVEVQISASSTFLCFHIPLLLMHFTGMFNGWVMGAEGQGVVKVKAHVVDETKEHEKQGEK
ncbi:hypothetical protein ADUPG1_014184, partial [Aduncisulcus paluster]